MAVLIAEYWSYIRPSICKIYSLLLSTDKFDPLRSLHIAWALTVLRYNISFDLLLLGSDVQASVKGFDV